MAGILRFKKATAITLFTTLNMATNITQRASKGELAMFQEEPFKLMTKSSSLLEIHPPKNTTKPNLICRRSSRSKKVKTRAPS